MSHASGLETKPRSDVARWPTIACLALALGGPPVLTLVSRRALAGSTSIAAMLVFDLVFWGILTVVLLVVVRVEREPLSSIGLGIPTWSTLTWGLGLFFATTFLLVPAATRLTHALGVPGYERGMAPLVELPIWYRVFLALSAGVVEEPLYRGYAVDRLARLTGSPWLGASIAVAAFGLAHLPAWGPGPALVATAAAVVSAVFFLWKRDLVALVIAHVLGDVAGLTIFAPTGPS